ncbi:Major Facilitator Superfamily protein [Aphelenchoides avenae]|nr:Major Facilitator Superfamily protein [Aphelenchus avenae]
MKTSLPDLNDNYGTVTTRFHPREPGLCCSQRLIFALVAMVGCTLLFILRNDTSFAIVCMTNMTAVRMLENRSDDRHDSGCVVENEDAEVPTKDGDYVWDSASRGQVLSAFYWGYLATQILGGYAAKRFGAKIVTAFTVLSGAILNLFMPYAASLGIWALFACQLLIGVGQGPSFPAAQMMIANWSPPLQS